MQPRIKNPVALVPELLPLAQTMSALSEKAGVSGKTLGLMHMRISQINGCSVCVDLHARFSKKNGDTEQRLFAVGAWRDAPWFSEAERAALALGEAVTRLADREDPVPDHIWNEAAKHYSEEQLAGLLIGICVINMWNRLNVATRQVAGSVM